jgi:hypothetical protein
VRESVSDREHQLRPARGAPRLRARADARLTELTQRGYEDVRVWDPRHTSVGGTHALFLCVGDPARLGLPENPEAPSSRLFGAWLSAILTAIVAVAFSVAAFAASSP